MFQLLSAQAVINHHLILISHRPNKTSSSSRLLSFLIPDNSYSCVNKQSLNSLARSGHLVREKYRKSIEPGSSVDYLSKKCSKTFTFFSSGKSKNNPQCFGILLLLKSAVLLLEKCAVTPIYAKISERLTSKDSCMLSN